MFYFLHGNDFTKARAKLHELLEILAKKKPNAALFKIDAENWEQSNIDEFIGGQGLFEHKYIVVVDKVFQNKEAKENILSKLKEISASDNVFIFIEDEVDKTTLTKIEKKAEKVQEFSKDEVVVKKEFNTFSLTDALGNKDKKNLWILYQKALANNVEPEQIHGILFWQVKSMLLAQSSPDAKAAGLNPFVYKKSLGFARNFTETELKHISSQLIHLYHEARRGMVDFEVGLERWVLVF